MRWMNGGWSLGGVWHWQGARRGDDWVSIWRYSGIWRGTGRGTPWRVNHGPILLLSSILGILLYHPLDLEHLCNFEQSRQFILSHWYLTFVHIIKNGTDLTGLYILWKIDIWEFFIIKILNLFWELTFKNTMGWSLLLSMNNFWK